MDVRRATEADGEAIRQIYNREVEESVNTFDLEPRPMSLWEQRLAATGPGEHFLVAEHEGEVAGYATSTPFRPKPAYLHTRESTVYVAPGHQGRGTGRALYDDLLGRLLDDGVHLVVAAVALPNPGSLALHRACGFAEVGTMRQVGHKFGRWIDVTWLQRVLD